MMFSDGMDFYRLPELRNFSWSHKLNIVPSSDLEQSSEPESITEDYEYVLEMKKKLLDFLPNHVLSDVSIPLTILYLLIMILGVFGNIITCVVIVRNSTMRTATNYYLFSLAISDLMLLIIGMILDIRYLWQTYFWTWGLSFCLGLHYGYNVAYNASVLTVLAFSFERYLAICYPLYSNSISGLKRSTGFIITLWIIGSVLSFPQFFRHVTQYVARLPSGSTIDLEKLVLCEVTYNMNIFLYESLTFVIFYVVPLIVILILYVKMGVKIRESWKTSAKLNSGKDINFVRQLRSRQNTIKMLSVVVTVTFICWAPTSFLFWADQVGEMALLNYHEYHWVIYISNLFFYCSTVVNPVIYSLMSTRYRKAIKKTFCRKKTSTNSIKNVKRTLTKNTSF